MLGRGLILSLALAVALPAGVGPALAGPEGPIDQEYEIKAAYLYNFARYVEWPRNAVPGDDSTFVIGVLGPNPFGSTLDSIAAAKTVQDKKIIIRYFPSAKDYQPCHILFVSGGADENAEEKTVEDRLKAALARIKGAPALLVADTPGLAQKGGMINFYIEDNRVKLEINLNAATRAGLKISSRLLGLKDTVKIVQSSAVSTSQDSGNHARIS